MIKHKILILIIIFTFLFPFFSFGQEKIHLAEVNGEIKVGTFQYLKKAVRQAEKAESEYLIIKLDTPGGLLKSTKEIADSLLEAEIKIVFFCL